MRMVTLGERVLVLVRKIRLGESGSFGFRSSPADRFPFLFSIMVRGGDSTAARIRTMAFFWCLVLIFCVI